MPAAPVALADHRCCRSCRVCSRSLKSRRGRPHPGWRPRRCQRCSTATALAPSAAAAAAPLAALPWVARSPWARWHLSRTVIATDMEAMVRRPTAIGKRLLPLHSPSVLVQARSRCRVHMQPQLHLHLHLVRVPGLVPSRRCCRRAPLARLLSWMRRGACSRAQCTRLPPLPPRLQHQQQRGQRKREYHSRRLRLFRRRILRGAALPL